MNDFWAKEFLDYNYIEAVIDKISFFQEIAHISRFYKNHNVLNIIGLEFFRPTAIFPACIKAWACRELYFFIFASYDLIEEFNSYYMHFKASLFFFFFFFRLGLPCLVQLLVTRVGLA